MVRHRSAVRAVPVHQVFCGRCSLHRFPVDDDVRGGSVPMMRHWRRPKTARTSSGEAMWQCRGLGLSREADPGQHRRPDRLHSRCQPRRTISQGLFQIIELEHGLASKMQAVVPAVLPGSARPVQRIFGSGQGPCFGSAEVFPGAIAFIAAETIGRINPIQFQHADHARFWRECWRKRCRRKGHPL